MNVIDYKKDIECRATNDDFHALTTIVTNVYRKLKQLGIVQCEIAKCILPQKASSFLNASENINTKQIRMQFVAKQAELTAAWINEAPLLNSASIEEFELTNTKRSQVIAKLENPDADLDIKKKLGNLPTSSNLANLTGSLQELTDRTRPRTRTETTCFNRINVLNTNESQRESQKSSLYSQSQMLSKDLEGKHRNKKFDVNTDLRCLNITGDPILQS